jgi:polyisoprenoid-binding protein YceI
VSRGSKLAVWVGGVIVGLVVLVVGGTWAYIHVFSSDPKPEFSLNSSDTTSPPTSAVAATGEVTTTTAATGEATTTVAAAPGTAPSGSASADGTWTVGAGSEAGYRVKEVLFGQSTTAVGRTTDVTGSITLAGTQVSAGDFTVDMTTVHSDKSGRDGQFQGRIMDTASFPTSTFKLTQPIELGSTPAEGTPITATATGDLTLHGTTKSVTFEVQAQRSGSSIQVVGQIPITFADWGIPNPSFGPASTEDNGILEFSLVFAQG